MEATMDHSSRGGGKRGFFASRANIVLVGFLFVGGFYLVAEHRAHLWLVVPWLPWLLLLACPLMHLFMHGGHGGHGGEDAGRGSSDGPAAPRRH
jgi:hypothetical protein